MKNQLVSVTSGNELVEKMKLILFDFTNMLISNRIIILLIISPIIILTQTSQGEELIELMLERYSLLNSRGLSLMFLGTLFYYFTCYLLFNSVKASKSTYSIGSKIGLFFICSILPLGLSFAFLTIGDHILKWYFSFSILVGYSLAIQGVKWNISKRRIRNKYLLKIFQNGILTISIVFFIFFFLANETTNFKYVVIAGILMPIYFLEKYNTLSKLKLDPSDNIQLNKIFGKREGSLFEIGVILFGVLRLVNIYDLKLEDFSFDANVIIHAAAFLYFRIFTKNWTSAAIYTIFIYWINYMLNTQLPASLLNFLVGFIVVFVFIWNIFKWDKFFKRPYSVFIISILFVFSRFNDNTGITLMKGDNSKVEGIDQNIENWLHSKTEQANNLTEVEYIPILVSEGGGIRSAYWTTGVLFKLDSIFPNLIRNTYAISGVSGGSVGEMFFMSLRKDLNEYNVKNKWKQIIGSDYLGDVTIALTVGNCIQSLIPYPIKPLDRSSVLSNDWSRKYYYAYKPDGVDLLTLENSIYSFYEGPNKYWTPNIFFNTTHVETGNNAIISNLRIDQSFSQSIDLLQLLGSPIKINTAAMLSSRFPGITPSGAIMDIDNKKIGRIVDGGYYDNSGLLTAIDISNKLSNFSNDSRKLVPVIIFIRNSNTEKAVENEASSNTLSGINAFYNSWASRTERTVEDTKLLSEKLGFEFHQIQLEYETKEGSSKYPLGWTLSFDSQRSLSKAIDILGEGIDNEIAIENQKTFKRLKFLEKLNYQILKDTKG